MIDFKILSSSIEYYERNNFTRIETPWLVTEYVDSITRPENVIPYRVDSKNKNFVASAEQGFLYLYLKEYLPKGQFQSTGPCLRNDSFDLTHTKYFIKNELIKTDVVNEEELLYIVDLALTFFNKYFDGECKTIKTNEGYDINYKEYELGSYGIRNCDFLSWIYGTACAEPRLSKLIKIKNNE